MLKYIVLIYYMNKQILLFLIKIFLFSNLFAQSKSGIEGAITNNICFTENKGQIRDQNHKQRSDVLFTGTDGRFVFHIRNNGISYQINRPVKWKTIEDKTLKTEREQLTEQSIYRVDINWLNVNSVITKETDESLPGYSNYYLGQEAYHALNVKSFSGVWLNNLYANINLHYYEKDGALKYDYVVAPHANYNQIQFEVKGAEVQLKEDGSVMLKTPFGNVTEGRPIAYQNGKQVAAKWKISKNVLSFDIDYDPNNELVIDPLTRVWATYYGGSSGDDAFGCTTDLAGNVYITGETGTGTSTIIATTGAHQTIIGANNDVFLVKLNSAGIRQWGTYYGDQGNDIAFSCSTDASGNVFVCGITDSNTGNAIATLGSHQSSMGGATDAFLVKFNNNGVRQWGTYYGGSGNDYGESCSADTAGNVYLVGYTDCTTSSVIATSGAHQSMLNGIGYNDAFLIKFNSNGVRQWGTYYGDSWQDYGFSCSTDKAGNVYLSGFTSAGTGNAIATAGAHQTLQGGGWDAFLVKFNSNGIRQWGTYYGGSGWDQSNASCTDSKGNIYLAGHAASGSAIATTGVYQPTVAGNEDAFIVKFDSNGVRQWGSYFGDADQDRAKSCSADANGNVYLTGIITSFGTSTVCASAGALQTMHGGGLWDAFFVKFDISGRRLWSTYYGGSNFDVGSSCSTDSLGNAYLAGYGSSGTGTVIATTNGHQPLYGGGTSDAFLVKFGGCSNIGATISANSTVCTGVNINFTASAANSQGLSYSWTGPNSFTSVLQNPVLSNPQTMNTGVYTLVADDGGGCSETKTMAVTVNALPMVILSTSPGTNVCIGEQIICSFGGADTYSLNALAVVGNTIALSPTISSNYTVTGMNLDGCVNFSEFPIVLNSLPNLNITQDDSIYCVGESAILIASGAATYTWNNTINDYSISISPTVNTSYTVVGTDVNGCQNSASITQTLNNCTGIPTTNKDLDNIRLFPNPNSGNFILELPTESVVVVLNTIGQIVFIEQLKKGKNIVCLSYLENGIYLLKTCDLTFKVIKE